MGDFNVTLNLCESLRGNFLPSLRAWLIFMIVLKSLKLKISARQVLCILRIPHGDNEVLKKLDRVMGNACFVAKFP